MLQERRASAFPSFFKIKAFSEDDLLFFIIPRATTEFLSLFFDWLI